MKTLFFASFLLASLLAPPLYAQDSPKSDTGEQSKSQAEKQLPTSSDFPLSPVKMTKPVHWMLEKTLDAEKKAEQKAKQEAQKEPLKIFSTYMPKPHRKTYKHLSEYYWQPIKTLVFAGSSALLWYSAMGLGLHGIEAPYQDWAVISLPAASLSAIASCWYGLRSAFSLTLWGGHSAITKIQNNNTERTYYKGLARYTRDYNYIKKQQVRAKELKERKMRSLNKHRYMHDYSLLHMAVAIGDTEMVDWMLQNGHHINEADSHGHTPIDIAAHTAYSEGYKKLLQLNQFKLEIPVDNNKKSTSLTSSLQHLDIINNQLVDMNDFLKTPINPNKPSKVADRLAHLSKRAAKKRLKKWHVMMNQMNILIVKQEHHGLDFYDIPKPRQHTYRADEKDRQSFLALTHFLNDGLPVNMVDADGNTPLHIAVMAGNWHAAEVLKEHAAPMNVKNKQGLTPAQIIQLKLNGFKSIYNYIVDNVPALSQTANAQKNTPQHLKVQQMGQNIAQIQKTMQNKSNCQTLLQTSNDRSVPAEI